MWATLLVRLACLFSLSLINGYIPHTLTLVEVNHWFFAKSSRDCTWAALKMAKERRGLKMARSCNVNTVSFV